jgi:prophage regulatory protein
MLSDADIEVVERTKPKRFLRSKEVQRRTGLSTSTLYDKMARGEFPKPVSLGPQIRAWLEDEIADWQAARIAERDNP